jgi:hypothetical protein
MARLDVEQRHATEAGMRPEWSSWDDVSLADKGLAGQ